MENSRSTLLRITPFKNQSVCGMPIQNFIHMKKVRREGAQNWQSGRQAEKVNKSTFCDSKLPWFLCVANLKVRVGQAGPATPTIHHMCMCVCAHLLHVFAHFVCVVLPFWRLCLQWRRWLPTAGGARWCPLRHTFWLDSRVLRAVRCQWTARGNPTVLSHLFVLVGVQSFPRCPGPTQSQPTLLLCLHLPVIPALAL